jgi:hypothetical protein
VPEEASATSYVGVGLGGYVGLSEVLHEQPNFPMPITFI